MPLSFNQFNVILNQTWLKPDKYSLDYEKKTVTLSSSLSFDKHTDFIEFLLVQPKKFKVIYDKVSTTITTAGQIVVPEPFTNYCKIGNEFLISKGVTNILDSDTYSVNQNTHTVTFNNPSNFPVGTEICFY